MPRLNNTKNLIRSHGYLKQVLATKKINQAAFEEALLKHLMKNELGEETNVQLRRKMLAELKNPNEVKEDTLRFAFEAVGVSEDAISRLL